MHDFRRTFGLPRMGAVCLALGAAATATGCHSTRASPPDGPSAADEVNVGYGTRDRDNLTGSVSSLTEEQLGQTQGASMERMLRGRIPGLRVVRLPSGELSLEIRDRGQPLVVIDGSPSSTRDLLALSPEVVARIDVLKDATASVYGSRSANGVILVTTKRGR